MKPPPTTLRELWSSMGFSQRELAAKVGAPEAALSAASDDPGAMDAELAARLEASLGLSLDALLDGAPRPSPLSALLKGDARALSAEARFTIAEAVAVARQINGLRGMLGLPTGLGRVADFEPNADYGHPDGGVPVRLASLVRARLGVPDGRVELAAHLLEPLGVVVLWARLPAEIDALAFAEDDTGAVIVANPDGAHMQTAPGRRMAFAHELCHLLFDRPEMARFGKACVMEPAEGDLVAPTGLKGAVGQRFERIERRARAFAPALLAPPEALALVWRGGAGLSDAERLRRVCAAFGISASAASMHLANAQVIGYGEALRLSRGPSPKPPEPDAELAPVAPPPGVPWLRGGALRALAARAFAEGLVSRRWAEEAVAGPWISGRPWSPEGDGPALPHRVSSQGGR